MFYNSLGKYEQYSVVELFHIREKDLYTKYKNAKDIYGEYTKTRHGSPDNWIDINMRGLDIVPIFVNINDMYNLLDNETKKTHMLLRLALKHKLLSPEYMKMGINELKKENNVLLKKVLRWD